MALLSKEQLEELKQFDAPTICNAIEFFDIRPKTAGFMSAGMIQRTCKNQPMVGYAVTAKVSALHPGGVESLEQLMSYYSAVREMKDPTIAVIQDVDPFPVGSFWGEVQATVHQSLGAVGTITQGGVRDLEPVDQMGFGFFSTHLLVSHGHTQVVESNCSVEVCGLTVRPGNLLFADCHGVVEIPHEIAAKLAEACRKAGEAELPMLEPCRAAIRDGRKPTDKELREWRLAMVQKRQAFMEDF